MGKTRRPGNTGASPKGARATHTPNHKQGRNTGYQLGGGVPWPTMGDGTPYTAALERVRHRDFPDWVGRLQWTEFRGADGEHLGDKRTKPATKTKPERVVEGAEWYGVVSWDNPDEPDRPLTRLPLGRLEPE